MPTLSIAGRATHNMCHRPASPPAPGPAHLPPRNGPLGHPPTAALADAGATACVCAHARCADTPAPPMPVSNPRLQPPSHTPTRPSTTAPWQSRTRTAAVMFATTHFVATDRSPLHPVSPPPWQPVPAASRNWKVETEIGNRNLEIGAGNWNFETGNWSLEIENWKLESDNWKLEIETRTLEIGN